MKPPIVYVTARKIREELGWLTKNVATTHYVTYDHLLDEAERRYWQRRADASAKRAA